MAVSAWVEVTGLAIWAVDLWRSMNITPVRWSLPVQVSVTAQTKVAEVIDRYPQTRPIFLKFGFTMIDNPVAREVFARSVSLEQACRLKHVDCQEFLRALEASTLAAETRPDALVQLSVKAN